MATRVPINHTAVSVGTALGADRLSLELRAALQKTTFSAETVCCYLVGHQYLWARIALPRYYLTCKGRTPTTAGQWYTLYSICLSSSHICGSPHADREMSPKVGLGTGPGTRGWDLWIISVVMVIVAGLFVAARLSQKISRKNIGLDDYLILASLVTPLLLQNHLISG